MANEVVITDSSAAITLMEVAYVKYMKVDGAWLNEEWVKVDILVGNLLDSIYQLKQDNLELHALQQDNFELKRDMDSIKSTLDRRS